MNMLSSTLVAFSRDGAFPDEDASKSIVESSMLPAALEALAQARTALEVRLQPCQAKCTMANEGKQ